MKRKKRAVRRSSNVIRLVAAGLSGIFILTVVIVAVIKMSTGINKQNKLNPVIAPYYDRQAFEVPTGLQSVLPIRLTVPDKANKIQINKDAVKIPIIMYHYVEYIKDINDIIRARLDITPDLFEAQLLVLHNDNYKTYFVRDVPEILNGTIAYSSKGIILSFDDGYEDFYQEVFPLLKKYQMKATLYIINDYIGRKGFLNVNQIKELIDSGLVEIGAHTLDHVYLKSVSPSIARDQILNSKNRLEEQFGITIDTFAYPYGVFTQEVTKMVDEAGYTAAVSVIPGSYQSADNLFYLSRIRPGLLSSGSMLKTLATMQK